MPRSGSIVRPKARRSRSVEVTAPTDDNPYDSLSQWHVFSDAAHQIPADGVIPYEVISPLFSDDATKFRFLYVPKGQKITYSDAGAWDFPVGSLLIKTSLLPRRRA